MTRSPRRRDDERPDDAGFTLVELLVAMGLFSLLVALVMGVVVGMSRETITATNSADNAAGTRRAYTVLDRQVRSAEALNPATNVAGRWYLEMRLGPTDAGGQASCVQWRLGTDGVLAYRTYPVSGTTGTSDWSTVVTDVVVPAATATPPLRMLPADQVYAKQRLDVLLTVQRGGTTRPAQLDTSLVARNTTSSTVTNSLAAASQVCTQGGRP